ncbi:hypothetical protein PCASD_19607 [Puccinia coronata f. sp. avenae]|uniref:Transposase n=1 Tax=Puccinia coronata f. sp. avenae TaxID=200324 RepID=A0A2N5SJD3_9BASI|nr:hypothetical protein PCASD_19607 [Puccinia coronata f. sp. avenae]
MYREATTGPIRKKPAWCDPQPPTARGTAESGLDVCGLGPLCPAQAMTCTTSYTACIRRNSNGLPPARSRSAHPSHPPTTHPIRPKKKSKKSANPADHSNRQIGGVKYQSGHSNVTAMVFRKYSRDVKLVAVKMALRGLNLGQINKQLDLSISHNSLRRWRLLYQRTLDVARNPALYGRQGCPVTISREESQFILDALELEPTLYVNEIQTHLNTITGQELPLSSIHNKMRY